MRCMSEPLGKSDFEAALEARKDLGPEMEPALVESFAEKVVAEIRRQQAQSSFPGHMLTPSKQAREMRRHGGYSPMGLAITSMALAIPLTAIALAMGGIFMGLAVWVGIVAINFAAAFGAFNAQDPDRR